MSNPASASRADAPANESDASRAAEIRETDAQVWDFTQHLVHPAACYVAAQIALWIALEDNAAFRAPRFGFWAESAVHLVQFFGAWAVLYGTLLRDMRQGTRAPTILLWFSVVGAAVAWTWPDRADPAAADGLSMWLGAQLVAALLGWAVTFRVWRRAKRAHEASAAAAGGSR